MSDLQIISSDDDDDYELPSLAERIKACITLQNQNKTHYVSSDSEDEDSSFLKFSEVIQSTPCSQVKLIQKDIPGERIEESKNLKDVEKTNPPPLNIRLNFSLTSESEDEELEFLNFSQRIRTPQVKSMPQVKDKPEVKGTSLVKSTTLVKNTSPVKNIPEIKILESCYITSESESDEEVFSNLTERLNFLTPRTENKENYDTGLISKAGKKNEFLTPFPPDKKTSYKAVDSESDESFTNFIETLRTPMSINKKVSCKTLDSESDESFSKFVEALRTPLSVNRKIAPKIVDSESDESFTSFIEKIRTPLSVNRNIQNKLNESDSDDSFLNNSRRRPFQTPKSQRKIQKDAVLLPKITEVKYHSPVVVQSTPNSININKSEVEREFKVLFDPEKIDSAFLKKRESYTHKLYEFYNKKVFNSRLPSDMPVFYDCALKTTAGITCCYVKDGIWSCSIKLSSSIMNSFDRLKQTLLHEMCHAAVWIVNKKRNERHGPLWQTWASRCKLILPFIECPTRCHNYEISYAVWYQCPKCQWKKGRCKQVKKYHGALCQRCKTPITVTYN